IQNLGEDSFMPEPQETKKTSHSSSNSNTPKTTTTTNYTSPVESTSISSPPQSESALLEDLKRQLKSLKENKQILDNVIEEEFQDSGVMSTFEEVNNKIAVINKQIEEIDRKDQFDKDQMLALQLSLEDTEVPFEPSEPTQQTETSSEISEA